MPLFKPCHRFNRITDIPVGFFATYQIEGIVLDIDNTLTTHDNPQPGPGVMAWLDAVKAAGCRMVILSNNKPHRVEPFARMLGLDYEARGRKPLTGGVRRACRRMGTAPGRTALIGDQIFTDILGGNRAGLRTVFVDPIEPEAGWFFRLKRRGERIVLRRLPRGGDL